MRRRKFENYQEYDEPSTPTKLVLTFGEQDLQIKLTQD